VDPGAQTPASGTGARAPATRMWTPRGAWHSGWLVAALIALVAAALRLAHLGAVVSDPFYDGAVRSMTLSWHNFFFGAVEPSGAVAIDKPPVDLWLQVASVEALGWGSAALKLPQALAGTLAVPVLFVAIKRVFGVRAGLAAALALAVLPIEVITARSDTMDAVMMALMVLALALAVRASETGGTLWLLAAAAALGVAFNVKLLESLPALAPLALLAWLGLPGRRRRRAGQLALAAAVYAAVSLAWLSATLLYPAHDRPYAYGSTNGSAWNSAFVFNGLDRLEGKSLEGPEQGFIPGHRYPERTLAQREAIPIVPPSPTRLLARIGPLSGERLGLEALAGLLLGGALLLALLWERRSTARWGPRAGARADGRGADDDGGELAQTGSARATLSDDPRLAQRKLALAASLILWLVLGIALFSDMARLHPRYTEAVTPAVAGTLGIGIAWATERRTRGRLAALTATLLAVAIYAESLLFGATALWLVTAASAIAALALAWTARPSRSRRGALGERCGALGERCGALGERCGVDAAADARGAVARLRANWRPTAVLALALLCVLAIPLSASLRAVRENVSDTNRLGVLHAGELAPLSAYLRAHEGSAYYEAAFDAGTKMGELVVRDARPILVLSTLNGKVFTPVARLRALAAAGRVRYAFLDTLCGPHPPPGDADCSAPARWVQEHGTDVSGQAGMPRRGMLWLLPGASGEPSGAAGLPRRGTSSGARRDARRHL
jgi:4-amino-4-deoxy-L-arabinose transferase-like glycosyltransferase